MTTKTIEITVPKHPLAPLGWLMALIRWPLTFAYRLSLDSNFRPRSKALFYAWFWAFCAQRWVEKRLRIPTVAINAHGYPYRNDDGSPVIVCS